MLLLLLLVMLDKVSTFSILRRSFVFPCCFFDNLTTIRHTRTGRQTTTRCCLALSQCRCPLVGLAFAAFPIPRLLFR
uniref:Putative secreted protein n=1 Tax=Anopheles darlingi TaxID=43151 RepID=A0A2M4D6K8_ANODA